MQATARTASVVSSTLPARRRLIRDVRPSAESNDGTSTTNPRLAATISDRLSEAHRSHLVCSRHDHSWHCIAVYRLDCYSLLFAIIGGTRYEGGATGIVLFAAFAATPLIAVSHLLITIGATPLRIARLIWVATCIYVPLVWLAMIFGSIHGHTEANGTGSWTPLIIYILITSAFVAAGMTSVFRQSSTPDSLPLYPGQP